MPRPTDDEFADWLDGGSGSTGHSARHDRVRHLQAAVFVLTPLLSGILELPHSQAARFRALRYGEGGLSGIYAGEAIQPPTPDPALFPVFTPGVQAQVEPRPDESH